MKNDIKLIPLQKEHIELAREWRNSSEVSNYMYTSDTISKEDQEMWFNKISVDTTSKYWMIEYNNKFLGVASLTSISEVFESCYWAFYLGDTSARGGGVGSKIEFNIISHVFDILKLNKLRCEVFAFNEKVIQMHEKFGFRREAYYRQHLKKNSIYHDVVGLALLKAEWDIIKEKMRTKIYGE